MSKFRKIRHVVPAFPIRELPSALMNEGDQLEVVANQYIPLNNPTPSEGDITILLCHANGFGKELYEPLLDDLLDRLNAQGIRVRGAWLPDMYCQGESGILNEHKLGGEVAWFDHTRDILSLISHFPSEFTRPVVGIGHSMGGAQLFRLSTIHPTLFAALIGIDPVITDATPFPPQSNPVIPSSRRRDIWPSMAAAEDFVRKRAFYKHWDPRVVDLLVKHGFRELPTALHPNIARPEPYSSTSAEKAVTLATTKHQEVFTFFNARTANREDPWKVFASLGEIDPPVLYIQGELSTVNHGNSNEQKLKKTKPPVEMIVVKKAGHLVPMERPTECADLIAPFVYKSVKRWGKEIQRLRDEYPPSITIPPSYIEKINEMERRLLESNKTLSKL